MSVAGIDPARGIDGLKLPAVGGAEAEVAAELGDLAALRAAVAAARATMPAATDFLTALETFAAQAQLAPLRVWIARALQRTMPPNP